MEWNGSVSRKYIHITYIYMIMCIYIYIIIMFIYVVFSFMMNRTIWNGMECIHTIDHLYIYIYTYDGYLSWELLEWICFMDIQYSMSRISNK